LNKKITVNSIHPGWVKTKLSTDGAPLTPEFSANGIFNLIEKKLPNATFWNAETQEEMPW
jgi:NAD(P)-dependent dehydrogenase (short-subunit alcohol dehydrogenase family)